MFAVDKAAAKSGETDEQQRVRFQVELEFVQCLANPNYLNCKQRQGLRARKRLIVFSFLRPGAERPFEE